MAEAHKTTTAFPSIVVAFHSLVHVLLFQYSLTPTLASLSQARRGLAKITPKDGEENEEEDKTLTNHNTNLVEGEVAQYPLLHPTHENPKRCKEKDEEGKSSQKTKIPKWSTPYDKRDSPTVLNAHISPLH